MRSIWIDPDRPEHDSHARRRPFDLRHRMFPGALTTAAHHQQIAPAEPGTTHYILVTPSETGERELGRYSMDHTSLRDG